MNYYGQFNPQVDKVLHERYFQNKFNGISIEAGAYDGITDNCTKFFEDNYNWKTINIEPLPHIFDILKTNRPKSINLDIALSNIEKISIFKNYKHPQLGYDWGNGSINHTFIHKEYLEDLCGKENYIETQVQCKSYTKIINELNIDQLDLFVLDVEGNEFNVIDGMIDCNILPDVFVIEHGHTNKELISDKLQVLNKKYKLDYVSFVNSFYIKI